MDEALLRHIASDIAEPMIVILTALAGLGGAMFWIYKKVIKPAVTTIDALNEIVSYHLKTNGGRSLLDKVNRMERSAMLSSVAESKFHKEVIERLEKLESNTKVLLPEEIHD